jgi:hypothetical protein
MAERLQVKGQLQSLHEVDGGHLVDEPLCQGRVGL